MLAAAHLFNVTGETSYEDVVNTESVCTGPTAVLDNYNAGNNRNQVWASAAYLMTPRTVRYPTLQSNMRASMIYQAKQKETNAVDSRPSRRACDLLCGYFRTSHYVDRTMVAHAVTTDAQERTLFRRALVLEADYGLGRNPLNMIQMTTQTTGLAGKRSVQGAYTSGRNDGVPGMHPGHTPYMNLDDWYCGMEMGCPSRLHGQSYPANFTSTWPIGEGYFNTRYVWAHNEFTPQQTMRGKMALYGYLYGLGDRHSSAVGPGGGGRRVASHGAPSVRLTGRRLQVSEAGEYELRVADLSGRTVWARKVRVGPSGLVLPARALPRGMWVLRVRGCGMWTRLVCRVR